MTAALADALRSLRSNFLQTFLSMLGVIIGVGALVAMLSVIDGLEALARETLAEQTPLETMTVSANEYTEVDGVRVRRETAAVLDADVLADFRAALPQPAELQLAARGNGLLHRDTAQFGVVYQASTLPLIDTDLALAAGRWPEPQADTAAPTEALVNFSLAQRLARDGDGVAGFGESPIGDTAAVARAALGQRLGFFGGEVVVVGVAEPDDDEQPNALLLAYDRLARHPQAPQTGGQLTVSFASVEDVLAGEAFAKTYFAERFAGIEDAVRTQTYTGYLEGMAEGFLVFRVVMGFLIGIAVVVGGVGIMNVLVMSVVERTSEIGIRKALGATRRTIMRQFLAESVALAVVGSAFGTVLGIGVALLCGPVVEAFVDDLTFRAVFTVQTLGVVAVVAVAIGAAFGTYPALRASRLDPVVAIRRG